MSGKFSDTSQTTHSRTYLELGAEVSYEQFKTAKKKRFNDFPEKVDLEVEIGNGSPVEIPIPVFLFLYPSKVLTSQRNLFCEGFNSVIIHELHFKEKLSKLERKMVKTAVKMMALKLFKGKYETVYESIF